MRWTSGVENWGVAVSPVESLASAGLARNEFLGRYVDPGRPVLLRGAVRHWPAFERWTDPASLAGRLHDGTFAVHRRPVLELKWRSSRWPKRFGARAGGEAIQRVSFPELARMARDGEFAFAYAVTLSAGSPLGALETDTGAFSFLAPVPPPRYYPPRRVFLHARSYTDWHYHPDDETLMCQFGAPKTVTLLPPDTVSFKVLLGIARHEDYMGGHDAARFPGVTRLRPRQVVVDSGDALYIPPNWWHAVECTDNGGRLGLTLAHCWGSPEHVRLDPRPPFRRFLLAHGTPRERLRVVRNGLRFATLRRRRSA